MSVPAASVQIGTTQAFSATVANDSANKGVTWALSGTGCSGATCGTVAPATSGSGVAVTYTAPAAVPAPATVTLTAASMADTTKSASTTITLTATPPPVAVTLSLSAASVTVKGSQAFTATVTGDSASKGVTWAVTGIGCTGVACGVVAPASSASGVAVTYTAPTAVPSPAMVTLKATSVADTSKSASATITVTAAATPPISVTLSLTTANVVIKGKQAFTATVAHDSANKGVTWTVTGTGCTGAACGGVSPTTSGSGVAVTYTAPGAVPNPATVTLKATSVADTTKSALATITITAASGGTVVVTLSPQRGGIAKGQALSFTATVANDTGNQGVTWTVTGAGSLSGQAATTATLTGTAAGSAVVTATSKADSTKKVSATIGVTDLAGVLSYHNDLSRDGVNSQEYALTTSLVNGSTFGKLFSCAADGAIYAQPLWVPNVNIGGGVHNVIVAATQHDSVYVFDADANPCVTYWRQVLIPAGETYGSSSDLGTADIYPDIGITGTPVVDASTGTIYLVSKTKTSSGTYHQRFHALSLVTGAEKTGSPVEIDGTSVTSPGTCEGGTTMRFDPKFQLQRPGLALVNGVVYVAWASHGDNGAYYHGWVVGYNAANLDVSAIFNDTKNPVAGIAYCRGGIWMSGGAPAADTDATGTNLYLISGNGVFDGTGSFGDSYMKLSTPSLTVTDFFTPFNQSSLDMNDQDVGSSGTALLINASNGKKLLVGGSKGEIIFVLDRTNMGGFNATDNVVQEFSVTSHSFSTPAFWNNTLYYFGAQFGGQQAGQAFAFNPTTGLFATTPTTQTTSTLGAPGSSPSISATPAATNGIVWAVDSSNRGTNNSTVNSGGTAAGPAILHAYDATNIATELWNSSQASGGRDTAGNAVKFVVPTVANGKVYVGTRGNDDTIGGGTVFGELDVYGLLPN